MSFVKFQFTSRQIKNYYAAALRNFKIADKYDEPEIRFRFCYDAFLQLAISVCAHNGLRVKSRAGHHVELIKKLAEYLNDKNIEKTGDILRIKRNKNLYDGNILISDKEAKEYIEWLKIIFEKAEKYFDKNQQKLKI